MLHGIADIPYSLWRVHAGAEKYEEEKNSKEKLSCTDHNTAPSEVDVKESGKSDVKHGLGECVALTFGFLFPTIQINNYRFN